MKIGISRLTQDLEEARTMLALARELGFDGVQLKPNQYGDAGGPPGPDGFARSYGELAGMARAGLIIYCPPDLQAWKATVSPVLEFAAKIGAEHVCLCGGLRRTPGGKAPHADAAAELNRLGAEGKSLGVHLSLHNHARSIFESTDDLLRMVELLDPEHCGLTLDTAHLAKAGEPDAAGLLQRLQSHLWNVHLKDLDENGRFCPIGRGTLNLRAVLEALPAINYEYWLIVDDESRDVGLQEAFTVSRAYLDLHPV
jgi:sugar phosphate isomerase/epimerase